MSQNQDNSGYKPKPSSSGKRGASDIRSFFGAKPKVVKRRSDEYESDKSEDKPLGNQPEPSSTNLGMWPMSSESRSMLRKFRKFRKLLDIIGRISKNFDIFSPFFAQIKGPLAIFRGNLRFGQF